MTGRDLIIYILQNNLENEPVFKDGKLLGFKTINEIASENDVGRETVCTWIHLDMIPYVKLSSDILIPSDYDLKLKIKRGLKED